MTWHSIQYGKVTWCTCDIVEWVLNKQPCEIMNPWIHDLSWFSVWLHHYFGWLDFLLSFYSLVVITKGRWTCMGYGSRYRSGFSYPRSSKQAFTQPKQPWNVRAMSDLIKTLITRPFLGRFSRSWAHFDGKTLWVAAADWRGCGCYVAHSNPQVTCSDHYSLTSSYSLLISFSILSLYSTLYYLHLHNLLSFILLKICTCLTQFTSKQLLN
jgi:hypothetical protein